MNTGDIELLKKAAKALGEEYSYGNFADGTMTGCLEAGEEMEYWNPLWDDGDAFRLLFSIGADVYHGTNEYNEPIITIHPETIPMRDAPSALIDSPNEIRRAIVCAAAATGDHS